MDQNPGCWRAAGLLRSSCLTSCVSRGLAGRRGGDTGRWRPDPAAVRAGMDGEKSAKGSEVWECGCGSGGAGSSHHPGVMHWHPGGCWAGGSSKFILAGQHRVMGRDRWHHPRPGHRSSTHSSLEHPKIPHSLKTLPEIRATCAAPTLFHPLRGSFTTTLLLP